jgi:hypothetical protein
MYHKRNTGIDMYALSFCFLSYSHIKPSQSVYRVSASLAYNLAHEDQGVPNARARETLGRIYRPLVRIPSW